MTPTMPTPSTSTPFTPPPSGVRGGGAAIAGRRPIALAALAAVAAAVLSACSSTPFQTQTQTAAAGRPAAASASAPATPPAGTTSAGVTAAFAAVTNETRSEVVTVGSGFQAADLDHGTIRFWKWDGAVWNVVGTSTYPPDATAGTSYTATITAAAALTGMDVASFVVTGDRFTGNSTGSTLAYTAGPTGWGVIKAGADALLHPSGEGLPAIGGTTLANTGLSYDEALTDGLLETVDCSRSAATAQCGLPGNQVVKYWRWDGTQFVLDHRRGPTS